MEVQQYTKSQRCMLLKIAALGGKQFTTGSLIQEMNKMFVGNWVSHRILDGILITTENEDVRYTLRFVKVNGFNSVYTLLAYSCGKKGEKKYGYIIND